MTAIACITKFTAQFYQLNSSDILFLMKIMISFPSLDIGGLSSLATELGTAAQLHGHEVMLITLYSSQAGFPQNIKFQSLNTPKARYSILKPPIFILRTFLLYFKVLRIKPDFVICLDPSSAFIFTICRFLQLKFKLAVSLYTPLNLLQSSDRIVIRLCYNFANLVVAPSLESMKDIRLLNKKSKVKIIPNPYTTKSTFCSWPRPSLQNYNVIQFLGRLSNEKGVDQILNVAEENKDLNFRISGDGPERWALECKLAKLALSNVELTGWGDTANYLPNSALLILTSRFESFGIVVIEAWLHGLPVIAWSGASGPRELIMQHGGGDLICEFDDLNEWGRKIREQINNPLEDSFLSKILDEYSGYRLIQHWLKDKTELD